MLAAVGAVPRHRFVPPSFQSQSYWNRPVPIALQQTISQPFVLARMTELAEPKRTDRALEVGTGSGYQAAVLAQLVDHVYSVEILRPLAENAARILDELSIDNVTTRCGDGHEGWPEHAPFDVVLVTAAPEAVPVPLLEQLAPGGRLVIPVGPQDLGQTLTLVRKDHQGRLHHSAGLPVRFVPMTGKAARER